MAAGFEQRTLTQAENRLTAHRNDFSFVLISSHAVLQRTRCNKNRDRILQLNEYECLFLLPIILCQIKGMQILNLSY